MTIVATHTGGHAGCQLLRERQLLSATEAAQIDALLSAEGPFTPHTRLADSIHAHLKLDDVADFPVEDLVSAGGRVALTRPGYVKISFADGVNLIASSSPTCEDDLSDAPRQRPFLDHLGVDIRTDAPQTRALFDALPSLAADRSWDVASQGRPGEPVRCCYVGVAAKHWLYPPSCERRFAVPVEFAIGPLTIEGALSGGDLRPARPSGCC